MPALRRILTLTLLLILCSGSYVGQAWTEGGETEPSPGSFGIKLLDAPAGRSADPRAHMYIFDHLDPGQTIQRRVLVGNDSDTPLRVTVYAAGAGIADDRFVFTPTVGGNELAGWISFDDSSLTLAPHARKAVLTTIAVPSHAVKGERYAVIWAQTAAAPRPGTNVTLVNRVGVRIYLDVGPGGDPPSDFSIDGLTAERTGDHGLQLLAHVHNTGDRALDMSGSLQVTDGPGSQSAGPFPVALGTSLAPGDVGVVRVPVDRHLPIGPWKAHLTLTSGMVSHTLISTVSLPADRAAKETASPLMKLGALTGCAFLAALAVPVVMRVRARRTNLWDSITYRG